MRTTVGLTAHDMSDMGRLAHLAANPNPNASREEIYLALASLYRIQGTGLSERERQLMRDVLRRLTRDVEMAIRIALAERLAADATAPHDLILLLVDDTIEVARPLILGSPLLTETDMLRLIAQAGVGHQEAAASRPHIGPRVTDALARSESETVLMALVRNATARISPMGYQMLVQKSRALSGLQEPLARRSDLPPQLAIGMCAWVSDALKTFITANFQMPAKNVETALSEAVTVLKSEPAPPRNPPADGAQKLVEKLAAAGQLRAGFLMRVLSQGQTDLFDLGFSRLLEADLERFRKIFYGSEIRMTALCCRAAGIDRSVFPTVVSLSRRSRGGAAALPPTDMSEVNTIFAGFSRQSAQSELRTVLQS
ncbi:MAG TPA: DUF2336 domain-containing protein [Rhizomicrobium sp.]|nr:DUF2336 domain-containing protein [Rhizomicrobium sp.]